MGRVDSSRICVIGTSAGGFTALRVLIHPNNIFAAAVSIYGVTDVEDLFKASFLIIPGMDPLSMIPVIF